MRIRQIRPEFFADGRTSRMSVAVRLTYIGLWCIADDAGWLAWDSSDIAAQLYPYESIRLRTRRLDQTREALESVGRLVMYPCGCAQIPTLPDHQRIGGTKSFTARDRHEKHRSPDKSRFSRTNPPVGRYVGSEVGNGASAHEDDGALIAAYRRQGLPVDA